MKPGARSLKPDPRAKKPKRQRDSRRRERCAESRSRDLGAAEGEPPGPRGACEQQSTSQGSE